MRLAKPILNVVRLALITFLFGAANVPPAYAGTAGTGLDAPISITSNGGAANAATYTAFPLLNVGSVPPLVMLVMSRDEQLFYKAYSDYSDLDNDGILDTTYQDNFNYSGYFGSSICYAYSSGVFVGSAEAAVGSSGKKHQCDGTTWSGNFLNWLTMSRLDVLRLALYGGYRSTDAADKTILERAYIPNDSHAWAKVYRGSDINKYVPSSAAGGSSLGAVTSFCNASMGQVGIDSSVATDPPLLRVANGDYSQWSSAERSECHKKASTPSTVNRPEFPSSVTDYYVRVQVCRSSVDTALQESFCKPYKNKDTNGNPVLKPSGLLQSYGENGSLRFGLLTGSWVAPRSGGILRRNIGVFAGSKDNSCNAGDEVDLLTGQFCYKEKNTPAMEGIVNTLDAFRIYGWARNGNEDQVYSDCSDFTTHNRQTDTNDAAYLMNPGAKTSGGKAGESCRDWGNPLSEMYAEALRYIVAGTTVVGGTSTAASATPAFVGSTSEETKYVPNLPQPAWKDPYKDSAYCANCSIVLISTGLNSFDSDEVPTVPTFKSAYASTTSLGNNEGLISTNNSARYLMGRVLSSTADLDVGKSVNTSSDVCTQKQITDLGLARGICPSVPSQEGSYYLSGLAYDAWTHDIRTDQKGTQKVQTYAIALAEPLPSFNIGVRASATTSDTVTIVPACRSGESANDLSRSCVLSSLTVGSLTNPNTKIQYGLPYQTDGSYGSFIINWGTTSYGSDYDVDATQVLTFCVGSACNIPAVETYMCRNTINSDQNCQGGKIQQGNVGADKVLVRTEIVSQSSGQALQLGYTVAGPNNAENGLVAGAMARGVTTSLLAGTNTDVTAGGKWDAPATEKFSTGPSQQTILPDPLFYAAKYGGFTDQNGDNKPSKASSAEWDAINNNTGKAGADDLPDNYALVRNPAQLSERLASMFNSILKRAGSGTAAAVVANSAKGVGLVYQALYQAERKDTKGRVASWSGTLNGLWTDSYGRLREDADGDGVLDGYDVDPVIEFYQDTVDNQTKFHREKMASSSDGSAVTFDKSKATITNHALDELNTVWSAQEQLWNKDFPTGVASDLTSSNRSYPTKSDTGRYIFTWIDADHDGVVDDGEQQPFIFSGESAGSGFYGSKKTTGKGTTYDGNFRYLNTSDPDVAKRIVAWIRGYEVQDTDTNGKPLWRSRTVDYKNDGTLRVLRLGDIVDSTPVVVGTPSEAFDLLYGDNSYGKFRNYYRSRRQMVYVGANDGMLHAFNGGFYNASLQKLQLKPTSDATVIESPLGGELWAYVPGNLLSHLRWLADTTYAHNFYVDGNPIAQDVKIFPAVTCDDEPCVDSKGHVDGWGTILIVPFRFGGGPISVDVSTDASKPAPQNSFSAYVVLDVTDPEQAPTVLAELTNTELTAGDLKCGSEAAVPSCADITKVIDTYTSSLPAEAMFRDNTSNSPNKFFLFTGSGTTDNGGVGTEGGKATSTTALKIRAYDMADWVSTTPSAKPSKVFPLQDIGEPGGGATSFAGDLIASDFNLDGRSEGLYFGSVKDNGASGFGGTLWKLNFLSGGNPSASPSDWTAQMMLSDLDRPITIRPTLGRNTRGAPMVFFGTGRAYSSSDLTSTQQQKIVGLIDTSMLGTNDVQYKALPLAMTDLFNTTSVQVFTDNSVTNGGTGADSTAIDTFQELQASFDTASRLGWYLNLTAPAADSTDKTPSERVVSTQSLLGGVLLTSTFFPGTDTCTDVGRGMLYGLNYKTGTASPDLDFFGKSSVDVGNDQTKTAINRSTDLGPGLPAPPSLHVGEGTGQRKLTACVQTSTGAIICKEITTLKSVLSSEISWHEPLDK